MRSQEHGYEYPELSMTSSESEWSPLMSDFCYGNRYEDWRYGLL